MTDLDVLVRRELDELAPEPDPPPDWDVIVRLARPPLRRRPLVLVAAFALAVAVCAVAVAASLGGFDDWLRGEPGRPAAFAIPAGRLDAERRFALVRAWDRQGHRVQRQGFYYRAPAS